MCAAPVLIQLIPRGMRSHAEVVSRFSVCIVGYALILTGCFSILSLLPSSATPIYPILLIALGVFISSAQSLRLESGKSVGREIPLLILLLRHGESTANVDPSVYETIPDHAIPLSDRGHKMALAAGANISSFLRARFGCLDGDKKRVKCKLIVSPFRRTRETASALLETDARDWISDVEESCLLVEQDWGMFEGTGLVKGKELYPNEYEHLQTQKKHRGKFWSRMPLGESAFDVCQRVVSLFGSIEQARISAAEDDMDAQVVILVSHGITSRAFTMMWCHYSPDWFDASKNFPNCAIRLLDSSVPGWDAGGIFGGFNPDGSDAPCQQVIADPVQTGSNELYYKFCTESRFLPSHRIPQMAKRGSVLDLFKPEIGPLESKCAEEKLPKGSRPLMKDCSALYSREYMD